MTTSDDDSFEESSGTADATVTYKYCQIVVPDFEFDVSGATATPPTFTPDGSEEGTRVTSGSSFLRLGSFPDLTATSPSGFANSVTLAKLVGDADGIADGEDDLPDDGILRVEESYAQDGYLLGFSDDTRVCDPDDKLLIAGQSCDNTTTARQTETKRLLTKGGWWDHSDGNRVTTTAGDKIEVIQGNYKLVVLGRRDPSDPDALDDHVAIIDAAGGNTTQQGMDPEGICIEYSLKDGRWCILQSETGNQTQKFHGKMVDYFTGPVMESWIGKDPDQEESSDNHPHITEKTWAKKIETYVGSVDEPVGYIFDKTYAKAITEETYAAAINNVTMAAEVVDLTVGIVTELIVGEYNEIVTTLKLEVSLEKIECIVLKEVFAVEETEAKAMEAKLLGLGSAICATESKLLGITSQLAGEASDLSGSVTSLRGTVMNLYGQHLDLDGEVTRIGGIADELYTEHLFA